MRCLRALLRLGRVGLEGVFCYFGVQSASMRVWGGAMRLFQMLIFRTLVFSVVTGGGAAFCNSCWSSAFFVAGGCNVASWRFSCWSQSVRTRGAGVVLGFVRSWSGVVLGIDYFFDDWLCELMNSSPIPQSFILSALLARARMARIAFQGPLTLARNTHRGARTHDHKVKGLALCRLS